jgi:hypothetical protein
VVLRPQTARNRSIKTKTQDVEKGSLCGKMGRRVAARVTLLVDMQSPKRLGQNNGRARRERKNTCASLQSEMPTCSHPQRDKLVRDERQSR